MCTGRPRAIGLCGDHVGRQPMRSAAAPVLAEHGDQREEVEGVSRPHEARQESLPLLHDTPRRADVSFAAPPLWNDRHHQWM